MRTYSTDSRIHEDFLDAYLEYTLKQESPEMFHKWVCISILCAALDRHVYMDRGFSKLFPNLYITLCAQSARLRKTACCDIGVNLLQKALGETVNHISQKLSPEALILELHNQWKKTEEATGFIYSPEFAVFIGARKGDDTLISVMTDLYDPKAHFKNTTIGRGEVKCENTCVNMLSATTPDWLKTSLPAYAIGGGFTSRIVFVFQSSTDRVNALPRRLTSKEEIVREGLLHDLRMIHRMKGEYKLTDEAADYYEDWYIKLYNPDAGADSIKGYLGRKHVMVLKVAMVLSACRRTELIITESEIEEALKILTENERELPGVMNMVQSSEGGATNMRIYQIIRKRGEITHTDLLRSCCHFVDAKQMSDVIDTLVQAKLIAAMATDKITKYKSID